MFSLESQASKLSHVNLRNEKHGEADVLSCDLKFGMQDGNDLLSEFHPDLKSAFFTKGNGAQGELINEPGRLTDLRFSDIPSIAFKHEYVGYSLTLSYVGPVSGRTESIELDPVTIGNIGFEFMQGGSVTISLRVQGRPAPKDVSRLAELLGHDCEITLTPPSAEDDLADQAMREPAGANA